MVASGAFAFLSDASAQGLETCRRRHKRFETAARGTKVDEGATKREEEEETTTTENNREDMALEPTCGTEFIEDYDGQRTLRYTMVHVFWNAPTHLPRYMLILYLFPGKITFWQVVKKELVNELIFSPMEALGVMTFVTAWKHGSCAPVPEKIRTDYPTLQLTKWAGQIPAHIIMFSFSDNIITMMLINYPIKFVTEILMAHIVDREVKLGGTPTVKKAESPSSATAKENKE